MSQRILSNLDLSSITLSLPSTPGRSFAPSPLPSPPRTPFSNHSPSGYLEKAKFSLEVAVKQRNTKASNTSIDSYVKEVCEEYGMLIPTEKEDFLMYMAKNLSINHENVLDLVKKAPAKVNQLDTENQSSSKKSFDLELMLHWEDKLRQSLQPPYYWLGSQISRLPGGVKFIIDLRADVLNMLTTKLQDRDRLAELRALDANLRDLLALWFTVGMLELERITWESSCEMLQKISEYEAVHPVRNWIDLKKRVGNYRRCFAFTHSCIPNEPLVVLHTFLTNEISTSMSKIVQVQTRSFSVFDEASLKARENSSVITTAIFYSITSTQTGLKGIELGNYLIKRVVRELQAELPSLSKFSSLSPVPGFMKWLQGMVVRAQRGEFDLFVASELTELKEYFCMTESSEIYAEFRRLLLANGWVRDERMKVFCEAPLMRLCAYYLHSEKRRGYAFDPVANFHLRNGAVMWRLNWNADRTPRGLDNSCGIMVNYRYFIDDCESNSKDYLEDFKIKSSEHITYMASVADNLLKKCS